jgi:hypothetical protein
MIPCTRSLQTINMQQKSNFPNNRTMTASVPTERGIQSRIGHLKLEQERLEEEVGQLRVAVEIYTEVVRRQALAAGGQASKNAPLWLG